MPKIRLDVLLVDRGLADSRAKAQALIMAGQVRVNDQVVLKPATATDTKSTLKVDSGPRFVSRGGEKLEGALDTFAIDVKDFVCADVGSSTGGFTDCMLQRGAVKVYAIDVGKGILHWKLRNDRRVVVMEQMNARFLESLPEPVSFITVDASFISLKVLLPTIKKWVSENTQLLCLIKPQFEAGKKDVSRGDGVIRNPEIHKQVLLDVLNYAKDEGFGLRGLVKSTLLGPKGNVEFLLWMDLKPNNGSVDEMVHHVMEEEIASDGNLP
ncbi:MAG: TlyA family RNA methyltransferase [Anaerolineales bacterium]|jgi:23S rRNA (cytidine1920-2'-O)/16S rRNA (cytidine1409-2'-O)-methyltransferase|nr:TlyA family RNA methyltransferase [Anaerolineales bacterium]